MKTTTNAKKPEKWKYERKISWSSPRVIKIVKTHYPAMSGLEIDKKFGFPRLTASRVAKRHGVRHTKQTEISIRERSNNVLRSAKPNYDVIARKNKMLRKMDELRVLEGKPQLTKLRIRKIPKKDYYSRNNLMHRWGYFFFDDEPYNLYFDGETRRTPNEEYFTKKYGFNFIEADKDDAGNGETCDVKCVDNET